MASSDSQRQIVASLISATRPRRRTSARMSGTWSRASGSPSNAGSSQAMALTSIARLGGKAHRTAPARSLLEAGEALLEEALAPFADHLPPGVEPRRDLVVIDALGSEEHQLGADDLSIRQRIPSAPPLQDLAGLRIEVDAKWASPWHERPSSRRRAYLRTADHICACTYDD